MSGWEISRVGIFFCGSFPGGNCPGGIIQVIDFVRVVENVYLIKIKKFFLSFVTIFALHVGFNLIFFFRFIFKMTSTKFKAFILHWMVSSRSCSLKNIQKCFLIFTEAGPQAFLKIAKPSSWCRAKVLHTSPLEGPIATWNNSLSHSRFPFV